MGIALVHLGFETLIPVERPQNLRCGLGHYCSAFQPSIVFAHLGFALLGWLDEPHAYQTGARGINESSLAEASAIFFMFSLFLK